MNHKKQSFYYAEGLPGIKESEQFKGHLKECEKCRKYVENYSQSLAGDFQKKIKKVHVNKFDKTGLLERISRVNQEKGALPSINWIPKLKWAIALSVIILGVFFYFNHQKPFIIMSHKGDIYIESKGKKLSIKDVKGELFRGESITTGKSSECYLNFGKNVFYLDSNTQVLVKSLAMSRQGFSINLDIKRGRLLSNIVDRKSISKIVVSVGGTQTYVKGTIFMVEIDQMLNKTIAVLKGEVSVDTVEKQFQVPLYKKLVVLKPDKVVISDLSLKDEMKFNKILRFGLYFTPKWQQEISNLEDVQIVEGENTYYIVDINGTVLSLDKTAGELKWKVKLGSELNSRPLLYKNCLFIPSSDGYIYCVSKGEIQWRKKLGPFVYSSPVIKDNKIYMANTKGMLSIISLKTKEVLVQKQLDAPVFSSPKIKGDQFIVGTISGKLYCLDINNELSILWEKQLEGRIVDNYPVFNKDEFFIGTFAGNVYQVSVNDGRVKNIFKVEGEINSPLVLKDDKLYIKSNNLYAFNLFGKKIWQRTLNFNDEFIVDDEIIVEKENKILYINKNNGKINRYYTKEKNSDVIFNQEDIFIYNQNFLNLIN